jgi:hypothetical protein
MSKIERAAAVSTVMDSMHTIRTETVMGSDVALQLTQIMAASSKHLPRRRFNVKEDQTLRGLVCAYGLNRWDEIARFLPERTPRQCRDRYEYYLAPNVYNPPWTGEEDELLKKEVAEWGSKWVFLTRFFPGRTGNHLKNRWYKVLSKQLRAPNETKTWNVIKDQQNSVVSEHWNVEDEDQPLWDDLSFAWSCS